MTEQLTTFLNISQDIIQEMDLLEKELANEEELHDMSQLEQSRILIQQLYLQVCSIGKNLKEAMTSHHSNKLYEKDFMQIVETHLETFTRRQTIIIEKWSKVETACQQQIREEQTLNSLEKDADNLIRECKALMIEMFPVIGDDGNISKEREDQVNEADKLISRLHYIISEVRLRNLFQL